MPSLRVLVSADFDLAIIGSGFAGSLLAMIARQLGRSVVLIEKGIHPRFAIGESSTPLANLLLEDLSIRYELPRLLPLTKWGTWRRTYPEIACGLKRGFSFFTHVGGRGDCTDRSRQLLVAASPHDNVADTHWFRADVDHFFLREAQAHGAEYRDATVLDRFSRTGEMISLRGQRRGRRVQFRARFVVDATGPRGFLHQALRLGERPFRNLPATEALFTHFEGVRRLDEKPSRAGEEFPPFPIDDAAVHHIFDGGWIWVLRFNHGVTSAGVAAQTGVARALGFSEGAAGWKRLLKTVPGVADQFAGAHAVHPFVYAPRLSFRSASVTGNGWALLPSAAGFVDPLLSTGFPLTLLGVERLAQAFIHPIGSAEFRVALREYATKTARELAATERLIAALYACMNDFPTFSALARLYFVAAHFSETARRLGRGQIAGGFLMHDHPHLGRDARRLCHRAVRGIPINGRAQFRSQILRAIEPFDLAGLVEESRQNWFPFRAEDLQKSAHKISARDAEIELLLAKSGFAIASKCYRAAMS